PVLEDTPAGGGISLSNRRSVVADASRDDRWAEIRRVARKSCSSLKRVCLFVAVHSLVYCDCIHHSRCGSSLLPGPKCQAAFSGHLTWRYARRGLLDCPLVSARLLFSPLCELQQDVWNTGRGDCAHGVAVLDGVCNFGRGRT